MTANEFWNKHAPDFNFELDVLDLLEIALERDVIYRAGCNADGEELFEYNPEWLEG